MSHDIENFVNCAGTSNSVPIIQPAGVLKPSDQLPPNSMLGQYFNKPIHGDNPGDEPPGGNSGFGRLDPDRDPASGSATTRRTMYKQLSPTSPDKYHGDADVMKYHKYITQCEQFCREAQLPKQDQVVKCADYLAGKAYKFYSTVVSMELDKWELTEFFKELFNYCFPPDFRLKQRKKLEGYTQGVHTITEY